MRFLLILLLLVLPNWAIAQSEPRGADRPYPAIWVPLLRNLTKVQVDKMQMSANDYCRGLDYAVVHDLYDSVSAYTLMQATAIMSVDVSLSDLDYDPPTKYRPEQIKNCWTIYRALGSRDVENLAHCFGDIQHFELLQRVAGASSNKTEPTSSSYCDKVAQAAGGSYMIFEECVKQENASRRRLGK